MLTPKSRFFDSQTATPVHDGCYDRCTRSGVDALTLGTIMDDYWLRLVAVAAAGALILGGLWSVFRWMQIRGHALSQRIEKGSD